ncbi:hypothetical protein TcWFU_009580 [Taenia crassiceps]|uniref:phosphomannomutase n=1 Tax=Taenia crassiceps TaxID=6207 RepID=A0ABR4Q056_9CEST
MGLLRNRGRKVSCVNSLHFRNILDKVITPEMYEFLCNLEKKVTIGLVGGSDLSKIREQMGGSAALHRFKHIFTENGLVAYRYDQLVCSKDIASHMGEETLQRLINFILRRLSEINLPVKRGTFVEFRKGMLNVSPIGRSCSQAEREAFYAYDMEHKIRETLVEVLRKEFAHCGLEFSIGGQISIDIYPTGWNKCFCLQFLEDYDVIHFFGDRTMEGGNDFEIFSHPRTIDTFPFSFLVEGAFHELVQLRLKELCGRFIAGLGEERMGDSDDDNDIRRTRDKFRRERSDVDSRREKREPFDDRIGAGHSSAPRSRPDRRPSDYRSFGGPRDRLSFGNDLPTFRSRETRKDSVEDETNYRPPLMPFKRFLEPLDDFITDDEAVAKYKEYKESFNKRYIEEFFEAHKNEEWLREKYHPDFIDDTREQVTKNIRQRLDVFLDLFDKGMIDNQSVDMENAKNLIKLMDAVVIKLNGGTDDDLAILDNPDALDDDCKSSKGKTSRSQSAPKSEGEESDFYSGEELDSRKFSEKVSPKAKPAESKPEQTAVGNDWTGVSSESESEERPKPEENLHEEEEDYGGDTKESENEDGHPQLFSHTKNADEMERPEDTKRDIQVEHRDVSSLQNADNAEHSADSGAITGGCSLTTDIDRQDGSKRQPPRRNLHKTSSIFFRCLPPTITRKELEDMCASQPGFIRLAIYDPMPERRFTRHAWATYEPNANIKKICWALNTNPVLREKWHQGRDSNDLCATVNRDLAQRIRPVSAALTRHRPVMRNDLRIASRLVAQLDTKHSLWSLPGDEEGDAVTNACPVPGLPGVFSANPLMRNLTDFLIDETASEEEAMLNRSTSKGIDMIDGEGDKTSSIIPLDTDSSLLRALDRLIIYLRIVYSIDYYAATLYQLEDLMPHRCGIFHARGTLDSRGSNTPTVSQREVNDYIATFNEKMASLLDVPRDLTNEEIEALGARDPEAAAEDFIEANIQKRTSKKKPCKVVWVCPLSDKKFREPVFVRKHILNKHMEKVEAAKKDNAIFFNNFLRDPKRPSLPEAPRHLINRFYPPPASIGPIGDAPGMRGRNLGGGYRVGGGYRGGGVYRSNSMAYGPREYFGGDGSHHGVPVASLSASANIYGNTNQADMYALPGHNGGRGGSPRGGGYKDYNGRKRPYPGDGPRSGGRGVISYNDLDDPGNDGF